MAFAKASSRASCHCLMVCLEVKCALLVLVSRPHRLFWRSHSEACTNNQGYMATEYVVSSFRLARSSAYKPEVRWTVCRGTSTLRTLLHFPPTTKAKPVTSDEQCRFSHTHSLQNHSILPTTSSITQAPCVVHSEYPSSRSCNYTTIDLSSHCTESCPSPGRSLSSLLSAT